MGLALPPELTLAIAEILEPVPCFKFATTCKQYWNLCESLIEEHNRLYSAHQSINASSTSVRKILKDVLQVPRHGWYFRDLSLPSRTFLLDDPLDGDCELFIGAFGKIEEIYKSIRVPHGHIEQQEKAETEHEPHRGRFMDPMITTLIHHLPHLRSFRFCGLGVGSVLWQILWLAVHAYTEFSLDPRLPFRNLRTVAISHTNMEGCCYADWARAFMCIPSLENLVAHGMGRFSRDDSPHGDKPPSLNLPRSNVRELLFVNCRFSAETLGCLIAATTSLEKFSYNAGSILVDENTGTIDDWQVIEKLSHHCGHSLKHIVLEAEDLDGDSGSGGLRRRELSRTASFQQFQCLKTLTIEWQAVCPGSPRTISWETLLPQSLELLYLKSHLEDGEWQMLTEGLDRCCKFLPRLRSIYAANRWHDVKHDKRDTDSTSNVAPKGHPSWAQENPLCKYLVY